MDKCEVCGWYEELGLHHFVWASVRKSNRAELYIEALETGQSYEGELDYLRGRYQVALAHEAELDSQVEV